MQNNDLPYIRNIISHGLIKIGIKCDLVAFNYLCYAIELVIKNPTFSTNLCENVYNKVVKAFNLKNVFVVERNIRNAIDILANTKGFSSLNKIFGTELYSPYEKPTPGELINLMAEYYRIGLYKKSI